MTRPVAYVAVIAAVNVMAEAVSVTRGPSQGGSPAAVLLIMLATVLVAASLYPLIRKVNDAA